MTWLRMKSDLYVQVLEAPTLGCHVRPEVESGLSAGSKEAEALEANIERQLGHARELERDRMKALEEANR